MRKSLNQRFSHNRIVPQASQLDLSQDKISHFVRGSSSIKMPAELEKNMIHQTMELDIDYERAGILHKGQKATLTTYIKEMYPGMHWLKR